MNEFEWRRQMRNLRQPVAPQRDLWASIDAALENADPANSSPSTVIPRRAAKATRSWWMGAGLAASLLLICGLAWHLRQLAPAANETMARSTVPSLKWKPTDPRLAGAAIELDAARMELRQAIQQSPDSPSLQRILAHTENQQAQLRQLAREAG